jgi:hypothetical protein
MSTTVFCEYLGVLGKEKEGDKLQPVDVFLVLFEDKLIEHIAFQTNLYATQTGKTFKIVTKEEMKVFLAINLLMGIKRPRSYHDCWSSHDELRDFYISSLMPVKIFSLILSNIHANDNSVMRGKGDPNFDNLYRIRPVINSLLETFKENHAPTREQAIDD